MSHSDKNTAKSDKKQLKKQSDLAFDVIFDDKLYSEGVTLLSSSQNRLIKTIRENNEK